MVLRDKWFAVAGCRRFDGQSGVGGLREGKGFQALCHTYASRAEEQREATWDVVATVDVTIVATVDFHGLGLRLSVFLLHPFSQGTRGGCVQGAKVACLLIKSGQALSWGVVRRTASLTLLLSRFCA